MTHNTMLRTGIDAFEYYQTKYELMDNKSRIITKKRFAPNVNDTTIEFIIVSMLQLRAASILSLLSNEMERVSLEKGFVELLQLHPGIRVCRSGFSLSKLENPVLFCSQICGKHFDSR